MLAFVLGACWATKPCENVTINWLYKPCDESEKLYLIFVSELLALDDSKLRAGTYDVPNKKILK